MGSAPTAPHLLHWSGLSQPPSYLLPQHKTRKPLSPKRGLSASATSLGLNLTRCNALISDRIDNPIRRGLTRVHNPALASHSSQGLDANAVELARRERLAVREAVQHAPLTLVWSRLHRLSLRSRCRARSCTGGCLADAGGGTSCAHPSIPPRRQYA